MVAHGRKSGAQGATARRRRPDRLTDLDDLLGFADGRAATSSQPLCEFPGCSEPGEHRAPKDRSLGSYYRFCLEHVRAYNKAWNYYAGMDADEIERHVRTSTIWDRPTWRMGSVSQGGPHRLDPESFHDPMGIFAAAREAEHRHAQEAASPFGRDSKENRALRELELAWPITRTELRARYKVLVKRHHPDANNGAKDAEERFKRVSEAYHVLLAVVSD
ncbi:J domain-containing protein [Roseospira marina]|uniref:J domain-containing protein n=1 Tax=Roseospira marina TaxID=140057 RepID=A0A5M6IIT1_9PROT|nr:J domain-containing protein [Roseospira marina]KAA5607498.1 J domain-containing protein [Roseospira marina]MBB4312321.1 hypothetical protein [Roseospira marina]MBB5085663.1 hypothetical protein [Roseospira marina]